MIARVGEWVDRALRWVFNLPARPVQAGLPRPAMQPMAEVIPISRADALQPSRSVLVHEPIRSGASAHLEEIGESLARAARQMIDLDEDLAAEAFDLAGQVFDMAERVQG